MEDELRIEFKNAYELFSAEIDVIKELKCKSVNTSHMSKGLPFTVAIIYFVLQGLCWIFTYIAVLNAIEVQYELIVENVVYIPALTFFFVEMAFFPYICRRIIMIDVLLDEKSAAGLMGNSSLDSRAIRRYKRSEDFVTEEEPFLSVQPVE